MDSGNSASLQSSSGGGGDDEFDSRCGADSSPLSALFRPPPPPSVPSSLIYGLQELPRPPLSNWCSTAPLPAGADASPPSLPGHGAAMAAEQAGSAPPPPPRGSRKRARASRRAPTTVLTTDTSNFRAMVQEFTGIPAPPFAGADATARSRFDHLFPSRTASAAAGTGSPATLPPYLLRPFAQKIHAPVNISIAPASMASSDSYHQLTAASTTSALLGMQQSNGNHSFHQSSSLDDGKYAAHPVFDRGALAPPPSSATRLQDPADFLGLTHDVMVGSQGPHAHLNARNGHELSGLVGGAPITTAGDCKATYTSTRSLLERNGRNTSADVATATTKTTAPAAATAGMRTQAGVVDSWACTSD